MVAKKNDSAEAQLLKMIEASSGVPQDQLKQKKTQKNKRKVSIIKFVNLGLIVLLIITVLFLINEVMSGTKLLEADVDLNSVEAVNKLDYTPMETIPSYKRVNGYLQMAKDRNIFVPYEASEEDTMYADNENRNIARKTANWKLVGVSWLDTVESASVMVEDTNKQETFFLKVGEKEDGVSVKRIYQDSAVLSYQNEEITIHYDKSQM